MAKKPQPATGPPNPIAATNAQHREQVARHNEQYWRVQRASQATKKGAKDDA